MDHILKMLRITNTPTVAVGEEEIAPDADEPPDDRLCQLNNAFKKENISQRRASTTGMGWRESLLTRGLQGHGDESPNSPRMPYVPRGLSTTSSHSFASTAELTSDAESLLRSASPSPPPLPKQLHITSPLKPVDTSRVVIAPLTKDDKPTVVETGEAAVEKSLGRKRCIMFACKDAPSDSGRDAEVKPKAQDSTKVEAAPRKCRITFACPSKPAPDSNQAANPKEATQRQPSPQQAETLSPRSSKTQAQHSGKVGPTIAAEGAQTSAAQTTSPKHAFHEFASSHDETEEWVDKAHELSQPKLTIDDCLKKENAIRKIAKEAEEEAEAEEREQEEMENELDEDDAGEDDFAPSDEEDETQTDDGNESDNEEGFAESDSESDGGSEYRFWAPSAHSTRATSNDNITHFSARQGSRSRTSSTSSTQSCVRSGPQPGSTRKIKAPRPIKMRPGTPELPDSTDFVCGTLDEDRPLEAAYISCREQKRREKHIPIPQDIDPSFPTTDPEDADDDDIAESSDQIWIEGQFEGLNDESRRHKPAALLGSSLQSPAPVIAAPRPGRPPLPSRPSRRSLPPPKQNFARSPAPRRLFDHGPRRHRSPPPAGRLRSPRGSPTDMKPTLFSITINHLAQRPNTEMTSSLPHTPNPFFRNWRNGSQPVSRITSGPFTPGTEGPHPDLHVRGPVDIVIGLEKKRQKRKEKYWRQNCRKAAKEQAERKPPPGRGVVRMKELGLECAERTRGYGLGQPAQLVLSL